MKKVYIAGAINADACGHIKNMHKMLATSERVRKAGYAVYVPCASFLQGLMFGDWNYKDYFDGSIPFLLSCDALFLVPGWTHSTGTQKEIGIARKHGIPVYVSLEVLKKEL